MEINMENIFGGEKTTTKEWFYAPSTCKNCETYWKDAYEQTKKEAKTNGMNMRTAHTKEWIRQTAFAMLLRHVSPLRA
jgi:hypothetical protein